MSAVADANTNDTTANNLGSEFENFSVQNQGKMKAVMECDNAGPGGSGHNGFCAICLDKIDLQETALTKGCEHAYCVTCILRWASYNEHPKCPQCKHPFESLHVHRNLDGSLRDYMFEESICLLLRASWFKPLVVDRRNNMYDQVNEMEFFPYEYEDEFFEDEDDDDLEDAYLNNSASVRIGNRRWGDNGYVRAGRQEARPVLRPYTQDQGAGSSREPKKKEASSKAAVGRRAKRAMKREAADKAAAAKHQQHLVRMGRK